MKDTNAEYTIHKKQVGITFSIFGRRPPIEEDFAICRKHGINKVELDILPGWLDPADERTIANVHHWVKEYGISVNSVHSLSGTPEKPFWLADPNETTRLSNVEGHKQVIWITKDFGAQYIVVEYECYDRYPYWPHESPIIRRYPNARGLWLRSFEELLRTASDAGVKIAIENIDGLPSTEIVELINRVGPEFVGVCFDSSHASYDNQLENELEILAPYIIGTHLSDNDGLPRNQWLDRHWYPFHGCLDWDLILKTLVITSPCEYLALEVLCPEKQFTPEFIESLYRVRSTVEMLQDRD